jgi:Tfp pilus assembly protein PilX
MNGMKQGHRSERGSVLIVVMGFLFISVGLVVAILDVASNTRKVAQKQSDMEAAMYVAEAGMETGARLMESNLATIVSSATGATNGSGNVGSGSYTYFIVRTNISTYCIVSTGTVNNIKRVVSLNDVYQPTYAQFALWSATNGAIYFFNGETFTGHVHADDKLYFDATSGGPVFHSAVTSDAGTYSIQNGLISAIEFDQGLTLNSYQGTMADVDFSSAASSSLKNEASTSGQLLQGSTTITFNGGTMTISNDRQGWTNHVYTPPAEGLIYVQTAVTGAAGTRPGTIFLNGGTLSGRMTIASEEDMTIAGNIDYKTNPSTTPSSTDALGLITKADIWVGLTAPNNLTIDAAMMATGANANSSDPGSFGVTSYNTGSARGNLNIYGGIVQEVRGAVNTSSGGVISTGYNKNYSYDSRFINKPPPYYPTVASQILFSKWTESH